MDEQEQAREAARFLAQRAVGKRRRSKKKRHTLFPMSVEDIAETLGLSHTEFYRQLKDTLVTPDSVRRMPLQKLYPLMKRIESMVAWKAEKPSTQSTRVLKPSVDLDNAPF